MSTTLIILLSIVALDLVIVTWTVVADRRHAAVVGRATEHQGAGLAAQRTLITKASRGRSDYVRDTLEGALPEGILAESSGKRLVRAGFDSLMAPAAYAFLWIVWAIVVPLAALLLTPRDSLTVFASVIVAAVLVGLAFPPLMLRHLERARQLRIRRSIPDTLDLLLVCVEAGVSLDTALLRVGHEMMPVHPELAEELLVMNRRTNAGMRRDDALHGLFDRTGVEELRTLASSMIQSERWGTSIGRVLRVFSESLRRQRRQMAEKKAAVAGPKMVIPMALFILPSLLAIIGGPLLIGIGPVLDALGK